MNAPAELAKISAIRVTPPPRPVIAQIDLPAARRLHGCDYLIQRKSDGRHEFVTTPRFEALKFNAEAMPGGIFRVNDILIDGLDTAARWRELQAMARHFPPGWELEQEITDIAGAIANGEEGAVLKPWGQGFGIGWLKSKRSENFLVRVTDTAGARQSVAIEDATTGESRGRVALFGGKCDQVKRGSLLKVTGFGLTADGKIREPRPDNDTPGSWLIAY